MIQKTNPRLSASAPTTARPRTPSSSENSDRHWGSWSGTKHYSLEVIQHPIRARMCGFGDKDRRPLAPAAVAKMTVRREDNTVVDVDDIDVAFFVVTVDLWSQDGTQEMNLVLHPSSTDRYIPTHVAKPRRRGNIPSVGPQRPDQSSQPSLAALPNPGSAYAAQSYILPSHQPSASEVAPVPPPYPQSHPPPPPEHVNWGNYPPHHHHQPPLPPPPPPPPANTGVDQASLPPIHTFTRSGPSSSSSSSVPAQPGWHDPSSAPPRDESGDASNSYRGWDDPFRLDTNANPSTYGPGRYPSERYGPPPPPPDGGPVYAQAPYASQPPPPSYSHTQSYPDAKHSQYTTSSSPGPSTSITRNSYTRTLVGPLSANACKLNDEHRKPGIFFLFQDLSIRTEGTFRLRLRLMNVGATPAPEPGANRVMTGCSPILAQTFTEPFQVFSAKRFPGVPDTTALSIAFGNQGQKLPLRNRLGPRPSGRRRRGDSEAENSDDSDAS